MCQFLPGTVKQQTTVAFTAKLSRSSAALRARKTQRRSRPSAFPPAGHVPKFKTPLRTTCSLSRISHPRTERNTANPKRSEEIKGSNGGSRMTELRMMLQEIDSKKANTTWGRTRCSWTLKAEHGKPDQPTRNDAVSAFESHTCGDFKPKFQTL